MTIKNNKALSMPEVMKYIDAKEGDSEIAGFIKKFTKLNPKETREFEKKLEDLNLMKMKQEQLVQVINFLPETQEDLNKIFVDVSLDEDESKKILDTVKQFK
ncbi:MAG: hypothetical protein ABIH49_03410 [archaeon]